MQENVGRKAIQDVEVDEMATSRLTVLEALFNILDHPESTDNATAKQLEVYSVLFFRLHVCTERVNHLP